MNQMGFETIREFGEHVKEIITGLLTGDKVPSRIKGTEKQIRVFTETILAECEYLKAAMKVDNEEDPQLIKLRTRAEMSARRFERITGLEWPIK